MAGGKADNLCSSIDRQLLAKMTTGILYADTVKGIDYLTNSNSQYRYGVQKVESVERFADIWEQSHY